MSYSSTPSRSIVADDYLNQRVGNLSLQNDYSEDLYGGSDSYDGMGPRWDYQTVDDSAGGRHVATADTVVTELTPEEVRWFYKTEGEKRWLEFSGYDSYRIEMRYREMKQPYGSKYSSYSAFSDSSSSMGGQFGASSIHFPGKQGYQGSSQQQQQQQQQQQGYQHKIVVRGGLYDVNLDTWQCASIYWPGEECMITRGTWFYEGTWQPLDREQSTVLESKHLSMFQGRKMSEFGQGDNKGNPVHTEAFPDLMVEWFSPAQVYLYSENKPSKIVRSVTSRLGFHKSTGYRLFRGYKTDATLDDRPDVEINHLVFVIHGIGQKMDTGRIIRNTSSLRDCVSWLKQKYFVSFPHHRAEFFPVEWRSNLQLDGELVDAITPNTLQSLRQMLNASAMDIMYYTSPLYGGEVQRGLREELNRLYSMFSARNPYFTRNGGKISVIAHSLGCVILYDIIMGLKPGSLVNNAQQGLLFQIQNFFCLGSPLAVFLALRWKDSQIPGKLSAILPQRLCHRLYNVFHPTDPVAYRIEPLLVKEYYRIAPLVIQPYNAAYHTPYGELPLEVQEGPPAGDGSQTHQVQPHTSQPVSPGRGLDYRLDYILRESNLGVSYLSALTSHTAYWTNYDIAYFILTQIFPDLELGGGGGGGGGEEYREYHDQPYAPAPVQGPPFTLNQPFGGPPQGLALNQSYPGPSNQMMHQPAPQYQPQFPQQQGMHPMHHQQQQQPQHKQGFFERATAAVDGKQQQHASSPTKGKSFFPSFNLSSLTSPVKNLSNSLSNISNQMTNMASQHPLHGQPQQQQQLQQQPHRPGFMGNAPNKHNLNNHPGQFGPQQGSQMQQQHMQQQHQLQQQQHMQQQQHGMNQPHAYDSHLDHQQPGYSSNQAYFPPGQSYGPNQPRFSQPGAVEHRAYSPGPQGGMRGSQQAQAYQQQQRSNSPAQFGPLETPTGIIKPKMTRIQPKVPSGFPQGELAPGMSTMSTMPGMSTMSTMPGMSGMSTMPGMSGMSTVAGMGSPRGRCVSPLGQSKVICSRGALPAASLPGSMPSLPGYAALGGRSLSSGNLRHSSVVSGYRGTPSPSLLAASPTGTSAAASGLTALSRRTMSRPNLNCSGSGSTSALGMSSLVYNSGYSQSGGGSFQGMGGSSFGGGGSYQGIGGSTFGTKSFLNRDYSGPSSR